MRQPSTYRAQKRIVHRIVQSVSAIAVCPKCAGTGHHAQVIVIILAVPCDLHHIQQFLAVKYAFPVGDLVYRLVVKQIPPIRGGTVYLAGPTTLWTLPPLQPMQARQHGKFPPLFHCLLRAVICVLTQFIHTAGSHRAPVRRSQCQCGLNAHWRRTCVIAETLPGEYCPSVIHLACKRKRPFIQQIIAIPRFHIATNHLSGNSFRHGYIPPVVPAFAGISLAFRHSPQFHRLAFGKPLVWCHKQVGHRPRQAHQQ